MAASSFDEALRRLLQDEGGNDDDPQDAGGRTSRGITQREWDKWVRQHPERNLPADVWQAPQAEIAAIFKAWYWDALNCDGLPAGVDYTVFDYGVLSGISRSAKVLQGFVGVTADAEIGPVTLAATARANAPSVVNAISDERAAAYKDIVRRKPTQEKYLKGWTARVERVRAASLTLAKNAPAAPAPARENWLLTLLRAIFNALFGPKADSQAPQPAPRPAPAGEPKWFTLARGYMGFHEIGNNRGIEHFIDDSHTGSLGDPWCAIFANACLEEAGVPGTRSAMARSFEKHKNFVKLAGPALGAISTYWRGSKSSGSGHVNFYAGTDAKGHIGIGGNQSDQVSAAYMDMTRHTGFWWPASVPLPTVGPVRVSGLNALNPVKES
jgi:uncharacterized protein (TIGR02594 family)